MVNFLSQNHSNGGNISVSASVRNGLYKTYSESSSFSPSTAHDCYDDMELEQIVDDVDDMYREQSRRSRYELCNLSSIGMSANPFKAHDLIRRNAVTTNGGGGILSHLLNRSSQDIANEIARSLVDKALENDRKKLVRGRCRLSGDKASQEEELIVENYIEVSVNRITETMVNELLEAQVNDVANVVFYGCGGNVSELSSAENKTAVEYLHSEMGAIVDLFTAVPTSGATTSFGLHRSDEFKTTGDDYALNDADEELDEQMRELTNSGERWRGSRHSCSDACVQKRREREAAAAAAAEAEKRPPAVTAAAKQPSLPPAKKEDERRKRNSLGILLSSLREKVYHCRCVDCQEQRRAEGKPEPEVSIEVKELEMPDVPEDVRIVIPRTKKRGRPRIFPRLEDLLKHGRSTADAGGEEQMPPPPSPSPQRQLSVKRPRGRPRKHKVGEDAQNSSQREGPTATVRESTDGKLLLTIKNHRSVIPRRPRTTTKRKTKKRKRGRRKRRKRGRPRKLSESEEEEESEETTDDSDLDDEAFFRTKSTEGEYRVPHERPTRVSAGRNLKRFLDMEEGDLDGEEEQEEDDESLFVPVKVAPATPVESKLELQSVKGSRPPGKRGPGRPRKYPLPPPQMPPTPPPLPLPNHHPEITLSPERPSGAEGTAEAVADPSVMLQNLSQDGHGPSSPPSRCENADAADAPPLFSRFSEGSAPSTASPPLSVRGDGDGGRNDGAAPSTVGSGRSGSAAPTIPPRPLPPLSSAVSGLGGGEGAVGHRRRLTRSSSSPSSSPSKRWSELHEEQLPFAMVDDEPDADQDHVVRPFHLKRDESGGGGGGGFVIDCNGNRTDRRKLDGLSGFGGGGGGGSDEGARNEIALIEPSSAHLRPTDRGRRSVSSEIATTRPSLSRMASSSSPHPLCMLGGRAKSVSFNEKGDAPLLPECDGQRNGSAEDTSPPWPTSTAVVVESSSQIGSDGSVGGSVGGSYSDGTEEHYVIGDGSENAAVGASAKIPQACRSAGDNGNRSDNYFNGTEGIRDPITSSGGEERSTPPEATASTANVPNLEISQAGRRQSVPTSSAEGTMREDETPESTTKVPRENHPKEGGGRGRERSPAVRRTFRLHSEESASKLIDRLSGIVKHLNAKLGQSRRRECGDNVQEAHEDDGKNARQDGKGTPPPADQPFPGNAGATATAAGRLQLRVDRSGITAEESESEREKAMLFPDGGGLPTTATAFFPRGREGKEKRRTSPSSSSSSSSPHSCSSPEECREREKGNETDSDSGGGGNSDFVSMRDSNRLPPTALSHSRFPEEPGNDNENEVEEGREEREGNGLRVVGGGGERRREPCEMRRKLGRRGAESRIKARTAAAGEEGATEDGLGRRMRIDKRKAVKEKEEDDGGDDDDDDDQETDHQSVRDKDDGDTDDAVVAADTGAPPPGVSAPRKRPDPPGAAAEEDPFLMERKEALHLQIARVNREPRPSSAPRRRLPLPQDNALKDSVLYCLPGWSGIRLGSSHAGDRDRGRALVDGDDSVISSVSNISMLATSGQKG